MEQLTCFKAYDIRGKLGDELNEDIAYRIGRAFGFYLSPQMDGSKTVVVGGDSRLTSERLKLAVAEGLCNSGVNVVDIGMTGTEEVYFATFNLALDGGVEVTASHNPIDYNGMKFVREQSTAINGDTGLNEIKKLAEENIFANAETKGTYRQVSNLVEYVDHLMTYIRLDLLKPLKLLVNSGNGAAGHVIDEIESRFTQLGVPLEFIKLYHDADGNFPNGIPNPLLHENRAVTSQAILEHGADIGIAWDGDFDRCFIFDENGEFIEGYYIVGLLAETFLKKHQGAKIIHDPRLSWNTIDVVETEGGVPIVSKTGHAYIKERMREEDAVYGGEMSAHHYFRDFAYCDSGMIPWLLIAELISVKKVSISKLVKDRIDNYPSPGEINRKVEDADLVIDRVLSTYISNAKSVDYIDGISVDMGSWRFNLRKSNTEPLIRLNLETRADEKLMVTKTEELLELIT